MPRTSLDDPMEQEELHRAFQQAPMPAGGVPAQQGGGATVEVSDGVITARRVEVARDEAKILGRIKTLAAAAGTDWFYRYPVWNNRKRRQDWIEGPSIKLANAILMLYGNCAVDCRVVEQGGNNWMIYAKFVDYERGVSLVRPWLQDKGAARLGGDDEGRKLNMALQVGVSKAERNVITNGLEILCDFAFEEAQKNLVERIGRNIQQYRDRAVKWFAETGIELKRVEAVMGRTVKEWLAPDLARIAAEVKAIEDGMASADETWPREAPPEPRRGDTVTDVAPGGTQTQTATADRPVQPEGTANPQPADAGAAEPQGSSSAPEGQGDEPDEPEPETPRNWTLPADIIGQENILKGLYDLLDMTRTHADVDQLCQQNAERIAKFGGTKGSKWRMDVQARRQLITAGRI